MSSASSPGEANEHAQWTALWLTERRRSQNGRGWSQFNSVLTELANQVCAHCACNGESYAELGRKLEDAFDLLNNTQFALVNVYFGQEGETRPPQFKHLPDDQFEKAKLRLAYSGPT